MRHTGYWMLMCFAAATLPAKAAEKVASVLEIAQVWSGHPVGFALLTHHTNQYVVFYDTNRQATLGYRALPDTQWQFYQLPTKVGWDSHNYLTMAVDAAGCLHLSGNMHVVPLVYFRTEIPGDFRSLKPIAQMIGDREQRCTYPRFLRGAKGELIFTYRDGQSGRGDQILNVYDEPSRTWRRLLDTPLFSGQGKMNAYYHGPVLGPDGFFHLCWVWRDTPDCASNHDLSYARSRELRRWERSSGQALPLPITLEKGEIVDAVPVKGGLLNVNHQVGFDAQGRPMISYHKHDEHGFTQAYCARLENGAWKKYQVSDWRYRWDFNGGGTIGVEIRVGAVELQPDGRLALAYSHIKHGVGTWILDEATLKPIGQLKRANPLAAFDKKFAVAFPGLQFNQATDLGKSDEPGVRYLLRWQTLGPNRDRPRTGPMPPPTRLYMIRLENDV